MFKRALFTRRRWGAWVGLFVVASMVLALPAAAWAAEATLLISVASDGTQADDRSDLPTVSDDGKLVVFSTAAGNLVPNDGNGTDDIFVRNVATSTTSCVSVGLDGNPGNATSGGAVISGNGRYVAFYSRANNLVEGDTNNAYDYFVRDLQSGVTTRVSVTTAGVQAMGSNVRPAISSDGRYVAFSSGSTTLVSNDTNDESDVFVHDLQTKETTVVSVASNGTLGNDYSGSPVISDDGRYVAFESRATNLATDTNSDYDIFVHDRQTGETTLVSVSSAGGQVIGDSLLPSISGDGRYVTFDSMSTQLVANDTNGARDVFIHDRSTHETSLVSVSTEGVQGNSGSTDAVISGNGRYVVFDTYSTNLVAGQELDGIHMRDLQTGETSHIGLGGSPWISGTGQFIVFASPDSPLVPEDTNGWWDIYMRDRDYVPLPGETYSLSGQILANGSGLAGVTVTLDATHQAVTDADGKFTITEVAAGTYTLAPNLDGYEFIPPRRIVTVSSADMVDLNFEAFTEETIPNVYVPLIQK